MYNTRPQANWNPYTIPATPTITNNDVYALSCSNGAQSGKNPSQFLQWKKVGFPNGSNLGDLLYWDPSSGEEGAWVVLTAPTEQGSVMYWDGQMWNFISPPSGSTLHVLTVQNGNLSWTATQDC